MPRAANMAPTRKDTLPFLFALLLLVPICFSFSTPSMPQCRKSLAPLYYNEDMPFDDIRLNGTSADIPDDLPKNVAQEKVDETLYKKKTLYEILGASPTATRDELKRCYFKLAKATHPDALIGKEKAGNTDDFNDIAAAWRILGDPKLRKRYDFDLKARAFAERAQQFTNEKLEMAAPVVSEMVDNVAETTMAFGKAMGKGMAGLVGFSKMAFAVAKAVGEDKAEQKAKAEAEALAKQKAKEARDKEAKRAQRLAAKHAQEVATRKAAAKIAQLAAEARAAEEAKQKGEEASKTRSMAEARLQAEKDRVAAKQQIKGRAQEETRLQAEREAMASQTRAMQEAALRTHLEGMSPRGLAGQTIELEKFDGSNSFLKQLEMDTKNRRS